jgi:hypothetical protein
MAVHSVQVLVSSPPRHGGFWRWPRALPLPYFQRVNKRIRFIANCDAEVLERHVRIRL